MKPKPCNFCGSELHTSLMCLKKPRKPISKISEKRYYKKQVTDFAWFKANPPDENGYWTCYLQISPRCPVLLTRETLNREHVKSKARYPHLTYDIKNLKPACGFCNALKGSRDIEELVLIYPQLEGVIDG